MRCQDNAYAFLRAQVSSFEACRNNPQFSGPSLQHARGASRLSHLLFHPSHTLRPIIGIKAPCHRECAIWV